MLESESSSESKRDVPKNTVEMATIPENSFAYKMVEVKYSIVIVLDSVFSTTNVNRVTYLFFRQW